MIGLLEAVLGPAGGWMQKNITDDYWYSPRGQPTTAGVDVTEEIALTYATVYACVAKLAKTVATLPAAVMEKTATDERKAVTHSLNRIMQIEANPDTGAVTWREMAMLHLLLWGRWYAEEVRDNAGDVVGLLPRLTGYMHTKVSRQGNLFFEYTPPNEEKTDYSPTDLLQLHGLSLNGVTGISVIGFHRETVALGLAAAKFASSFYGKGAWMGGWLKQADGKPPLSAERQREHLQLVNERFQGPGKAFGLGFLASGLDYVPITGMPLKDAQYLESRQFTRTEVCGIYDVPPSKIQDHTRSTFSNVEQMNIDWSTDSILPWCIRIEAALKRRYFPDEPYYVKHNLAGIVRGDIKTRYDAYAVGRQWGWLSANDIRSLEDMNPISGGDNYLIPVNMTILRDGEVIPINAPQPTPSIPGQAVIEREEEEKTVKVRPDSFAGIFLDAAQQVVNKECRAIENAYKRRAKEPNADGFKAWVAEFYQEHEAYFSDKFRAPLETALDLLGAGGCGDKLSGLAKAYVVESHGKVIHSMKSGGLVALLAAWRESKADDLARQILSVAKVLPVAA